MPHEKWNLLPDEAPVKQFERWMETCGNEELYARKYRRIVEEQPKTDLFLSVIIRTQGKRREMLQDVLTSLQAQTDPDFEMIIICHRADPEGIQCVREQIDQQPERFRDRIRMAETAEGERGAPVNLGFALARGEYAVCLDDDDLVFDHWVQAFHEAAKAHPGMILHAYALVQPWEQLMAPDGKTCLGLTAAGRADGKYCRPYRTLAQQYENYCPFMGIAFPLYLFRTFHLLLNEEISTTEDWDYLLRVAGIPGVWDIEEPTAIYRQWNTKESSHQMVSFEEWEENYKKNVRDQIRYPILLNGDEAMECKKDLVGMQFSETKGRSCFMKDAVLFWAKDEPFSDDRHMRAPLRLEKGRMRVIFELETQKGIQQATMLRYDPADETLFCLKDLTITVYDQDRNACCLKMEDIREANGFIEGNEILFLEEDPRVVYPLPEEMGLSAIEVTAEVEYRCPLILKRWVPEPPPESPREESPAEEESPREEERLPEERSSGEDGSPQEEEDPQQAERFLEEESPLQENPSEEERPREESPLEEETPRDEATPAETASVGSGIGRLLSRARAWARERIRDGHSNR
ncbi:MAG: glycosyltransferase family 2 protein [Clostridia bacterium]|nr:glycosyltransferase family 2 protein [Clostridia bacterium]